MPEYSGITTLAPVDYDQPAVRDATTVDILLVHGLNGGAFSTWTSEINNSFWPRDFLPALFPTARVMTFGYNANILQNSVQGRIAEFADNLVAELIAERVESTELDRPLFFICHSLGGIVVKRAYAVARGRRECRTIGESTKGIIFLATPHRGSKGADWGSIGARLLSFVKTRAITELQTFSTVLEDYNSDFVDVGSNLTIISFYEKQETAPLGLIVERWSAIMGTENEMTRIAVSSNHRNICKFSSKDMPEFQTLYKQLKLLISKTTSYQGRGCSATGDEGLTLLVTSIEFSSFQPLELLAETKPLSQSATKRGRFIDDEDEEDLRALAPMLKPKRTLLEGSARQPRSIQSQAVLWHIPHFSERLYFDRDDAMKKLEKVLFGVSERSFGIYGLGGVGKTQLALKAVHTFSNRYSHVFWIPAENELKLSDAYRQMAVGLELIDDSETDLEMSRHAVQNWLRESSKWLIVFDNAEDTKSFSKYFPSPVKGSIIITSRSPALVERSIVVDGHQLGPLSKAEGTKFLLSKLKNWRDPSAEIERLASEVSEELGGHTLGLATMAAYINDSDCHLEEFLAHFRRNRSLLISKTNDIPHVSFDYELSFATCWTISMESLKGKDPGDLLGMLAMLDPDSISEDIFKNYAEDEKLDMISVLQAPATYMAAMIALRSHGLIDRVTHNTNATTDKFITVHRMVQEAATRNLIKSDTLGQAFDNTVECLRSIYPRQVNGESMFEDFPACRRLTSHITSLENIFRQYFSSKGRVNQLPAERETFIELLADAGWYLYETGLAEEANILFSTGESVSHDLFGDDPNPLTALIYNNIGVVHDSQNRPVDAMSYALKCLKIRELCLAQDDPEMGNAYSNLGNNCLEAGNFAEAQKYYEMTTAVHERAPVLSDDLLEGAYSNLGISHLYQDHLDDAERCFKRAMSHHKNFKSPNHFVALTMSFFGMLRMRQHCWAEARDIFFSCLELRKTVSGPNHRLVGTCLHQLAFVQVQLGRNDEAIELLREAIPIFMDASQTKRGLLERSLLKLADCLSRKGNLESRAEAEAIREDVKGLCKGDPVKENIPLDDERGWNQFIGAVCYAGQSDLDAATQCAGSGRTGLDIFIYSMKAGVRAYKRLGFQMEEEIMLGDSMYGGAGEHYTGLMIYENNPGSNVK